MAIFSFCLFNFFKLLARYRIGPGEEPARYIVTIGKWVKWVFFFRFLLIIRELAWTGMEFVVFSFSFCCRYH